MLETRTAIIRINDEEDIKYFRNKIYSHKHFENILTILIQQNYDLFKDGKDKNDFNLLTDGRVLRAVITGTSGGKVKNEVDYIKEKYKDNPLMQDLIKVGKELKSHNLVMLIKRLKASYKGFFTKVKNNDAEARPPKPKKLKNVHNYSALLDPYTSYTMQKKDYIGINVDKQMRYVFVRHEELKKMIGNFTNIRTITLTMSNGSIYLHISYLFSFEEIKNSKTCASGIDVGLNNLLSIAIDDLEAKSLIIDGKPYKYFNSRFNRQIANLQNTIDTLEDEDKKRYLKDFRSFLFEERNRYFYDRFHKVSTRVLEYLSKNNVTDIYISKNLGGLKNNGDCKLRKDTKQNFIQVPFIKLINNIEYKACEYGIRVHVIDESYTSKCSCISDNVVKVQKNKNLADGLNGSRVKRGLFLDRKIKKILNADLNAAFNHIKLGLNKSFDWLKDKLFKLCNPIVVKSDWEFVCLLGR